MDRIPDVAAPASQSLIRAVGRKAHVYELIGLWDEFLSQDPTVVEAACRKFPTLVYQAYGGIPHYGDEDSYPTNPALYLWALLPVHLIMVDLFREDQPQSLSSLVTLERDLFIYHNNATDSLKHRAEDFGIDCGPIHSADVLKIHLLSDRKRYVKSLGEWPRCLGDILYELPQNQMDIIIRGEETVAKLWVKSQRADAEALFSEVAQIHPPKPAPVPNRGANTEPVNASRSSSTRKAGGPLSDEDFAAIKRAVQQTGSTKRDVVAKYLREKMHVRIGTTKISRALQIIRADEIASK